MSISYQRQQRREHALADQRKRAVLLPLRTTVNRTLRMAGIPRATFGKRRVMGTVCYSDGFTTESDTFLNAVVVRVEYAERGIASLPAARDASHGLFRRVVAALRAQNGLHVATERGNHRRIIVTATPPATGA